MDSGVDAGTWDHDLREISRLLYHLLVLLLQGKAAAVARHAGRQNGADLWIFKQEFEPRTGGRGPAMLMGILDPMWCGDIARFAEYLREWEVAVSLYEDQASCLTFLGAW